MSKNYGNDSQIAEIVKYISDTMKLPVMGAGGGFAPIGAEAYFDGQVAPLGWVICDGTELNIADYPDLATYYASQHGASNYYGGDGITTFAVPKRCGMPSNGAKTNEEHIVSEWRETIDGVLKCKPVYEKKITMGALNITKDTDATVLDVSSYDIDVFITASIRGYESANIKWTPFGDKGAFSITTNGILRWRSNTSWAYVDSWLIIQYTKTTDSWQPVQEGHSADGNGIFCVKATVSDAEINAFNVYTPREHQVAWWEEEIDGVWKRKPVYERTWKYKKSAGEQVIFDCDDYDIEHIFVTDTHTMNNNTFNGTGTYYQSDSDKSRFFRNPDNNMVAQTGTTFMNGTSYATFRYTKTTDQWQTS